MPLYEYECEGCGKHFELIRKFSDPPVDCCPSCGGPVQKLVSRSAIQFKGAGWYITDYARKPSEPSEASAGDKPASGDDKKPASGDADKPASGDDKKPASKPDATSAKAPAGSSSDKP
jgi:putative FmdB family regulatory protein